ncbi:MULTISPECIES: carbohydrate ABC transporter permease [unclassified Microbacterium]|uniref:carbohydrate ABC transporter permease n=1 Tax=unclassified Microbacterium TaxID=2609290 RepID=UPI0012FC38DF|nr:sugar ABC transporter permease [Microbacterium sp. MAH-37]MVQ41258.1 ABC transporter permease subunit [Microbacterium sp. MAH-37]
MTMISEAPPAPSTGAQPARPPVERIRRSRFHRWVSKGGPGMLLFALPMVISFGVFGWWPILRSLLLSVQKTNFVGPATWVGLDNFTRVLADPLLGTAVLNTIWYTVLAMIIGFPVPVLLAVFIAELRRTRTIASVFAYIPVIIPPVVSVLLWKQFYDPSENGLFNTVLGWFGLGPLPWLQSSLMAMPSIVVQATWAGFGGTVIIYLAALMAVPPELYEAAEVDGAKVLRRFWHITLPQLRTVILFMLLLQVIGTFQVFTEPYVMTGGGPNNSTTTILMLIFRYAFIAGDYGKATALSLMLAVFLCLLSAAYLWLTRKWAK